MANTYAQIHIHTIFSVQNRNCIIDKLWKYELYKYITGIIQNQGHRVLAINGMPDHIHIFFGMRPVQSLSGLMQDIKGGSSKWINQNSFIRGHFTWQEGYGAFSYSRSDVGKVIEYIKNQEIHHLHKGFEEEYREFLIKFDIVYDERYIFKNLQH
jgi:REP element-mobilizing transposase RayT